MSILLVKGVTHDIPCNLISELWQENYFETHLTQYKVTVETAMNDTLNNENIFNKWIEWP